MYSKLIVWVMVLFSVAGILRAQEDVELGVVKIRAVQQDGKTYITFKKTATESNFYLLYRFTELPTEIGEVRPIAKISSFSYRHPDNFTSFVLPDGYRLTKEDGLFVYTNKSTEQAWYAVMPEGRKEELVSGKNILELSVSEVLCEKEKAVFQTQEVKGNRVTDYYALWMDFDYWEMFTNVGQWPKQENEYYASFFSISYMKGDETKNKPAVVSLHEISGGGNGGYFSLEAVQGQYRIYVSDHRKRWWKGLTEKRINLQIDSLIDSSQYSIDKDRVYLEGSCMGGTGVLYHALKYPQKYAAAYFLNPRIDSEDLETLGVNSVLPPLLSYFGYRDGDFKTLNFGKKGHLPYLKKMQESLQGAWVMWLDVEHRVPATVMPEKIVEGGFLRFRRNEFFPVFTKTSGDDNCGQKMTGLLSFTGQINQKIDWGSSLHKLNLPNSELVDTAEELSITFQTTELLTTDISFQRVQNFLVKPDQKITLEIREVQNNLLLQKSEVVIPPNGRIFLKEILLKPTGTRITLKNSIAAESTNP